MILVCLSFLFFFLHFLGWHSLSSIWASVPFRNELGDLDHNILWLDKLVPKR